MCNQMNRDRCASIVNIICLEAPLPTLANGLTSVRRRQSYTSPHPEPYMDPHAESCTWWSSISSDPPCPRYWRPIAWIVGWIVVQAMNLNPNDTFLPTWFGQGATVSRHHGVNSHLLAMPPFIYHRQYPSCHLLVIPLFANRPSLPHLSLAPPPRPSRGTTCLHSLTPTLLQPSPYATPTRPTTA